ncbi:MAG: 2-oxoglutarate dehydrogenase complex dihydrolipoyllysine-residue succinyltransferase [Thiotrichales bacterium]
MSTPVTTPQLPESVTDATIVAWHKRPGDPLTVGENLVDLETDKVVLEVPAPITGVLQEILQPVGSVVKPEDLLARIEAGATAAVALPAAKEATPAPAPQAADAPPPHASPSVRRALQERGLEVDRVEATGPKGQITRDDVARAATPPPSLPPSVAPQSVSRQESASVGMVAPSFQGERREERRVPMSRLRARIAERLVAAQHTAAILTTFNEIDMSAVMELRNRHKDPFEKRHGVRLGFMSFFVKAACEALRRFPEVNATIDGTDIVYHGYFDVGVAVGTERGLVVPIIRDADQLGLAGVEERIMDFANRARDGKLSMDDLTGGTFSISNGGVYGSLMSTPILNPPQSAILGMHKIEKRAVVVNDQIVIRPMMYVALSYDHRLIDGEHAVRFLVAIKEMVEDPTRLLLCI